MFGIAVQNGLVLIAQTRTLVAEGVPFAEALRTASIGRVRPKLMTAGSAMLVLLPLVLSRAQGGELERPLAIVMDWRIDHLNAVHATGFTDVLRARSPHDRQMGAGRTRNRPGVEGSIVVGM